MSDDERWDAGPADEATSGKPKTFAEKWQAYKEAGKAAEKPHPFGFSAAEFSTDTAVSTTPDIYAEDDEFLSYMSRFSGDPVDTSASSGFKDYVSKYAGSGWSFPGGQ